jgi:hypothetical protein
LSDAEFYAWSRAANRVLRKQHKIFKAFHKLAGSKKRLHVLVFLIPILVSGGSRQDCFSPFEIFVPHQVENNHANLSWKFSRLTESQWQPLQETFRAMHFELDASRKYRRRKPLPPDRLLLECILVKLALGLCWQDLKKAYPSRACQDRYQFLVRSGRMASIFEHLHSHLEMDGQSTLEELVDRGCFYISGNRVHFSSSEELTWEKNTALLLLQQTLHANACSFARRTSLVAPKAFSTACFPSGFRDFPICQPDHPHLRHSFLNLFPS